MTKPTIIVTDVQSTLCAHWEPPYCDLPAANQDLCTRHYLFHNRRGDAPPLFPRNRVSHRVSDYDTATGTGDCYLCGPRVPVYRPRPNVLICKYYSISKGREHATGWRAEQYDEALIAQANRCAICGRSPKGDGPKSGLVGDHCHARGVTRKLLCMQCNLALGMMRDDPAALRAAAEYVSS